MCCSIAVNGKYMEWCKQSSIALFFTTLRFGDAHPIVGHPINFFGQHGLQETDSYDTMMTAGRAGRHWINEWYHTFLNFQRHHWFPWRLICSSFLRIFWSPTLHPRNCGLRFWNKLVLTGNKLDVRHIAAAVIDIALMLSRCHWIAYKLSDKAAISPSGNFPNTKVSLISNHERQETVARHSRSKSSFAQGY